MCITIWSLFKKPKQNKKEKKKRSKSYVCLSQRLGLVNEDAAGGQESMRFDHSFVELARTHASAEHILDEHVHAQVEQAVGAVEDVGGE